ncbi:hypothetical protein MMC06_006336, partial [Schaereria dolodes]|nr:hypothetical protein [Schaereria dolodes]
MHIVPDALSRLANTDSKPSNEEGELDALYAYGYTATLAELLEEFKKSVIDGYKEDPVWAKTL